MSDEALSKEARILSMVKRVLTDVAKDTYTPPNMKHPLSESTIRGICDCLALISARETELAEALGKPMTARPRFADEPKTSVVVSLDTQNLRKKPTRDTSKD